MQAHPRGFGRGLLAGAFFLTVLGCGPGPTAGPTAGPTTTTPARAEDSQGSFRLVFELPKSEWQTSDAITGEATLANVGSEAVDYGSSGSGPILFSFDQLDGNRHVEGLGTPDCRWRLLEAGKPISSPIKKSGFGYGPSAQPSDFDRWFTTDPLVHLPPGWWRITAIAQVWYAICPVPTDHPLLAAVVIRVNA